MKTKIKLRVGKRFYTTIKDAAKAAGIVPTLLYYRKYKYGETTQQALRHYWEARK